MNDHSEIMEHSTDRNDYLAGFKSACEIIAQAPHRIPPSFTYVRETLTDGHGPRQAWKDGRADGMLAAFGV